MPRPPPPRPSLPLNAAKGRAIASAALTRVGGATVVGVVLAGGLARRMGGGDKALLKLGERPLLAHVLARLSPQVGGVVLNANGDPARFAEFDVPVRADPVGDYAGPLAGVLAGLHFARESGAAGIVSVAADTPFFPHDLVARLIEAATAADVPIAIAATREADGRIVRHPTFAFWKAHLAEPLAQALAHGTRKIVTFTDAHGAASATFDDLDTPFFNVNTPEDLVRAEALFRSPVATP